jgi:hypothetical protein
MLPDRGPRAPLQPHPVRILEQAMLDYLDLRNRNPQPFVWIADAALIAAKIQKVCERICCSGN